MHDRSLFRFLFIALAICLIVLYGGIHSWAQSSSPVGYSRSDLNRYLIKAAQEGDKATFDKFLDQNVDLNARDRTGHTALQWALEKDYREIAQELRGRGAKVGLPEAVALGEMDTVRALLERGANVDARNPERSTALHIAARAGSIEFVRLLLNHGAEVELQDANRFTPLMLAACEVRTNDDAWSDIVRLLRSHGANPDATDEYGRTALMIDAYDFNTPGAELLLDLGADPNATDIHGWTPLMWDVGWQQHDVIFWGRDDNHLEIARMLVRRGAELNHLDSQGMTALMDALLFDHPIIARGLLDLGADASIRDRIGRTAITIDARNYRPITADLIKHGARPGVLDAILKKEEATALTLLKSRPRLRDRGAYGETALMAAAEMGYVRVVHTLLQQGANPNDAEEDGLTALFLALGGRAHV